MSNVDVQIKASQQIPLVVEKVLNGIKLSSTEAVALDVVKGELELNMLSNVVSVSADSLYLMAVRMGYEGTEEDFVRFLMTESKDGFINIDNKYPLPSGHYTLDRAIAAVASDATLSPEQKNGMIFTFFDGISWQVFQYNKKYENPQEFVDSSNWRSFGANMASERVSGTVKLTDTINDNESRDVTQNTAVTPKSVFDYLNAHPGGMRVYPSYDALPVVGNSGVIYFIENSEVFYIYKNGAYKLVTPTWENIKIIRGETSIIA